MLVGVVYIAYYLIHFPGMVVEFLTYQCPGLSVDPLVLLLFDTRELPLPYKVPSGKRTGRKQ